MINAQIPILLGECKRCFARRVQHTVKESQKLYVLHRRRNRGGIGVAAPTKLFKRGIVHVLLRFSRNSHKKTSNSSSKTRGATAPVIELLGRIS